MARMTWELNCTHFIFSFTFSETLKKIEAPLFLAFISKLLPILMLIDGFSDLRFHHTDLKF